MRRPYVDFKALNASLFPHIETIVRSIDADARRRGAELWFADPGKGEDPKRNSASINVRTGKWHARATDKMGGDVVSLVAHFRGCSQADAAHIAASMAGVALPHRAHRSYDRVTSSGSISDSSSSGQPSSPAVHSGPLHDAKKERASKLWADGRPIENTSGAAYLHSRNIDPSVVLDDELRFISDLAYYNTTPDGSPRRIGSYPAILAPIRDGLAGELSGVLRIWVSPDGSCKAHIVDHDTGETQTPKKLAGKLGGGGIWFGLPGDTLIMCEGLEDALSLRQATGLPVVATSGWQQMGKTALPSVVQRLIVVPDDNSDPDDPSKHNVGERGLEQAARAYGALGIVVLVARLPDGKDSNDVLCTEGAEALAFAVEHAQPFDPAEQTVADEPPLPEFDEAEYAFGEGAAGSGELTEDSVALDFEGTNKGKFLFNATRDQWLYWGGSIWAPDETGFVPDRIREHCRGYGDPELQNLRTTKAVQGFCRAARCFARSHKDFDVDPMLLGTPGGTVDLRTGALRTPRPEDCISKSTTVVPAAGDPTRWLQFLAEATGDDAEFIRFLQQIAGYGLTGEIREQCLFFIYGDGGTGKSTYVNTLAKLLGSYARIAPMDSFVASTFDKHPTDLAMLEGSRLVTANETETGRKWATARIKSLSGGDPISARFMRQDFFTYSPTFKLLFVGNHAPNLEVVDEAMLRRFHVVPFDVKPKVKDLDLPKKLAAEAPQILRWAIEGCLDWQRNGLIVPARVKDATGGYFSEQDLFAQWMSEKIVQVPDLKVSTPKAAVLASWNAYRASAGEKPESARDLNQRMTRAGCRASRSPDRSNRQRVWIGIELVGSDDFGSKPGNWNAHKAA